MRPVGASGSNSRNSLSHAKTRRRKGGGETTKVAKVAKGMNGEDCLPQRARRGIGYGVRRHDAALDRESTANYELSE